MTITLELDPDTEVQVERKAKRLGVTAEEYVGQLVRKSVKSRAGTGSVQESTRSKSPQTPAQAIDYWRRLGVLGSYGDPTIDAPELARILRSQAETRS